MIQRVKILIVEDEFIVAEDIRLNLIKLDFDVAAVARTGEEAIDAFRKATPDIVLMDIRLRDGIDGIETATRMRNISNVPLIYLTAHSDKTTFERAKKTQPHAYIVKPFNFHNLHLAIELAFNNFSNNAFSQSHEAIEGAAGPPAASPDYVFNDAVFIRFGKSFQKIRLSDICFIKADGSYSVVHTTAKEFTLSMNLHTLLERLQRPEFLRVHRSYIVNLACVDRIDETGIFLKEHFIPVSKSQREDLLSRLKSL